MDASSFVAGTGLTRRVALARAGAGGLGLALLARPAAAEQATPAGGTVPPILEEYVAAFEAWDLDRVLETLATDVVFEDMATGEVVEGRDGIQAHYQVFTDAFSDIAPRYTSLFASGDWAAGEWAFTARYTGQMPMAPPGTGQEIAMRGVDVIELANGQIQRYREYYDLLGLLTQLGALEV